MRQKVNEPLPTSNSIEKRTLKLNRPTSAHSCAPVGSGVIVLKSCSDQHLTYRRLNVAASEKKIFFLTVNRKVGTVDII